MTYDPEQQQPQDDEARQHFTSGLAKVLGEDGQRKESRAATAAFLEAHGEGGNKPPTKRSSIDAFCATMP